MFSLVAIIPTIIISVFSVMVFNLGIQAWFDNRVSTAIEQSIKVADLYIEENKVQLRDTAISVANDLNELYFEVIHNPQLLSNVLNAQAEMRSLTEAIIYQKSTNTVMSQTALSFPLSFWTIAEHVYKKADSGEVAEIPSDPGKLRLLIKLREFDDTYLLVGRLVDEEIINYVDRTNGAASKYKSMMDKTHTIQVQFALMFTLISIILVSATAVLGSKFATKISEPLIRLVRATEQVQEGDLSVQVETDKNKQDEIYILSNAFNRMVKKIDIQQKDLALSQRTMAWADVASRVAHEIKNPLTPILLSADRIQKKFLDQVDDKEGFKKYISNIQRNTTDIQKIISEFAEFAKMPMPNFESVNIIATVKDIVETRQLISDSTTYNFSSNVEELQFMCDITQINQIFVNLFKNAEEAMETALSDKNISVDIQLTENDLEISVTDSGKGFSNDLIHKVTEPYITTRTKGTGLGLAIVKKIVQDHGGDITISNINSGGGNVRLIFDRKHLLSKVKK